MLAGLPSVVLRREEERQPAPRVEDGSAPAALPSGVARSMWSGVAGRALRHDSALAGLLLVAGLAFALLGRDAVAGPPAPPWAGVDVRVLGSTVALLLAVALRRRLPVVAVLAAIVGFAVVGDASLDSLAVVVVAALWVALSGVATYARWATVVFEMLAAGAALLVTAAVAGQAVTVGTVLILLVPIGIGLVNRAVQRGRRSRGVRAQRRSWEQERQAVAQERVRIARELHDVAAHHVSAIVVSAGAALRVLDRDPEVARRTLALVAESARRTSEAMERMLGTSTAAGPDDALPARPGLGHLQELVDHFGRIGCRAGLRVEGDLAAVPPDAALSAFRIVEEGLTNAVKHGGAVGVEVRVARTAAGLDVAVDDPGPPGGARPVQVEGSGQGLIGMAERVALFDGTLSCGPAPAGGWSVRASIPLR